MNYAYLLACADDSLYAGWTNDLRRRLAAHNDGSGSKYTRARRPVKFVYAEAFSTKKRKRENTKSKKCGAVSVSHSSAQESVVPIWRRCCHISTRKTQSKGEF